MLMFGSTLNPVDILGTASPTQYDGAFRQAMRDPNADGILGEISPTAVTDVIIKIYNEYKYL